MVRTSQRSEVAFTIDVTSSDVTLINGGPDTVFCGVRMTNALRSGSVSKPGAAGYDRRNDESGG
jgi:hypothetical protein